MISIATKSKEWIEEAEGKKFHLLHRTETGNLDFMAHSVVYYHNGPKCILCDVGWCWHCTKPSDVEPCKGGRNEERGQ